MTDSQVQPYRRKEMEDVMNTVKGTADDLRVRGQSMLDRVFPPEKRDAVWSQLQAFASRRPKLAAFLLAQLALSGIPLLIFLTFTVATFIFSLVVGLLIGLLGALLFTAFAVGIALFFVVPTLFVTTMAATFMFVWGVVGFYLLRWINSGEAASDTKAVGQKLNNITGGRVQPMLDSAKRTIENSKPAKSGNAEYARDSETRGRQNTSAIKNEDREAVSPEDPANGFTVLAEGVEEPFDQFDIERMKRIGDNVAADTSDKLQEAKDEIAN